MPASAAVLIAVWNPQSLTLVHQRAAELLAAIEGEADVINDTLGDRNRRLLMLHRTLVGSPLEARVTCTHCAAESEFAVPADAILATPAPNPNARVRIRSCDRVFSFRLPRMSDIEAASNVPDDGDVRRSVLERCRIRGDGAMSEEAVERLGRKFEALDPAANIVVNINCSGCARPIAASVDLAVFVARDLDRVVEALFRDINVIASAYGWSEQEILALAPERRRRYAAMIAATRAPARPSLVGRRA